MTRSNVPSVIAFDENHLEYERWFDQNVPVFAAEVRALESILPTGGVALEVGAGTGQFAAALGVAHAVEPSRNMALLAKARGARVCQALGEALPYPARAFDCLMLITVLCFVQNETPIIEECRRVLEPRGHLLIGMIDPRSELGAEYEAHKASDVFYRVASFHTVDHTTDLLKRSGFEVLDIAQTIIGMPYRAPGWDALKRGFGDGAFVVLLARKLGA